MISKSQRWQKTSLAVAAATVLGLWTSQASALSLGRISVFSALGEPLRAEIDIPDINAEETASLRANVAGPEAFRSVGLEYNPALTGIRISLQKRPDGRAYLRVSSDRAINDPYVDLMLEATWSSGRIVRDYTMLLDPPNLKQAPAVTPMPPQASSVPARIAAPEAPTAVAKTSRPAPAPAVQRAPTKPVNVAAAKPTTQGKTVTVKKGDTAGKIALTQKPAEVSLDQMLLAMLRANPQAFVDGNINRIRSGAVIALPSAAEANATPAKDARQMIVAQSKDFNDFRNKLAGSAPLTQVATADRQSSGAVQAKVDDKKASATAPDKLTLSQGTVQGKASEAAIVKDRQASDFNQRTQELAKNIASLNKLNSATTPDTAAPAPAPSAAAPAAPTAAVKPAAPTPATAPAIKAPATPPSAAEPTKPAALPAPAPEAESGLIDELVANPLVPAAAAGLIALLAGFGLYRYRRRATPQPLENSSFLDSRLQPDSFFGASGGQRVDTHEAALTASSMMYSPSQLDTSDDVDPVAEADVYLAYGRDVQAEEILKEAARLNPGRLAVHQKLLDIYAKRLDLKSFENTAREAYKLTGSDSQDWVKVCALGLGIDPGNTMYQTTVQPTSTRAGLLPSLMQDQPLAADMDLDLDFSLDEAPRPAPGQASSMVSPAATTQAKAADPSGLDFDFDLPAISNAQPAAPSAPVVPAPHEAPFEATMMMAQSAKIAPPAPAPAPKSHFSGGGGWTPAVAAPTTLTDRKLSDNGLLDFDFGSLSLDLKPRFEGSSFSAESEFDTKLELATEFGAIGDSDGARALIEEVIAESSGEMKAKAQKALSQLK